MVCHVYNAALCQRHVQQRENKSSKNKPITDITVTHFDPSWVKRSIAMFNCGSVDAFKELLNSSRQDSDQITPVAYEIVDTLLGNAMSKRDILWLQTLGSVAKMVVPEGAKLVTVILKIVKSTKIADLWGSELQPHHIVQFETALCTALKSNAAPQKPHLSSSNSNCKRNDNVQSHDKDDEKTILSDGHIKKKSRLCRGKVCTYQSSEENATELQFKTTIAENVQ